MTETYEGFKLTTTTDGTTNMEWTTIAGPNGRVLFRVRGVKEARYWADVYVQQNGLPV